MADLVQLRLEDFRAFRSATLDLTPNGLTLVAGPNNVGKSALLSAFDVVAGREASVAARHAAGQQARVWARWRLTDKERIALLGDRPETSDLLKNGAASWLEWEFTEFHDKIQPIAVSVSWIDAGQLEFGRLGFIGTGTDAWRSSVAHQSLAVWQPNHLASDREGSGTLDDTLPALDRGVAARAIQLLRRWRQGYFHFKPLREARGREAQLIDITPDLESTGANLATVLLSIRNNAPDGWERLVALVQQIVPGVGRLMTPVDGRFCRIVFQDEMVGRHQHNLKDLGTGVEQLLMTLVVGLTQTATTVVLEEPETGLHPGAQRALLGLLQDWSTDRLFVASTHSATMLDWMSPTTSVVSVSRQGSESTAAPVTTERSAVLRDLGVRLSDVLSAERILILEGVTDKAIFDVWFPEVIRNPRVVVVDGGGGYNARHADLFVKWLAEADQLGTRRVLYARDADELPVKFLESLEASPHVYVLPCRELENLLLDFNAIAAVVDAERKSRKVTGDAIASAARELADELKPIVVLKRVMADLADPVRLVDHKLRRQLSNARADKDALVAAVLDRVPDKAKLEETIGESWQRHSQAVDAAWEHDWQRLAPGADLLSGLWKQYLGRGYSKASDGLAVAQEMAGPPADLAATLREFMAEGNGDA